MPFRELYWARTPNDIPGLFEDFFGGFFLIKGMPLIFQLLLIFTYGLTWGLAWRARNAERTKAIRLFSFLSLLIASVLLFQPWDELFVNLKHSFNWAHYGRFSFNRLQAVEGTVDFLPLFITGTLGKFGLPLLETHFVLCLLGGWLSVEAGVAFLTQWKVSLSKSFLYPALLLFPPLILNCTHGFSTPVFTAFVLWGLYFWQKNPDDYRAWLFLSLVPLTRMEGIWLVALIAGFSLWRFPRPRVFILMGLTVLPFLGLSLWRQSFFGSVVPVPIQYKATLGNIFYLLMGLRNLLADLTASFALLFLAALSMTGLPKKQKVSTLAIVCILGIFILPYYSSGGDWFPAAWGRYFFPLSFFLFICFVWGLAELWKMAERERYSRLIFLVLISLPFWILPFSSLERVSDELFYPRRVMAKLSLKRQGRGNYRMQYLSQLGRHLKSTTPENITIASSEIATVMYFAERETLDLLGVANPEIAKSPVREVPDLIRRYPRENELPYLIFKRQQPDLVPRYRPEVIYTFDFFAMDLLNEIELDEITPRDLARGFSRWTRHFRALHGPLYGGLETLSRLGYLPIVVNGPGDFFSVYLVSKEFANEHFRRLDQAGFETQRIGLQE